MKIKCTDEQAIKMATLAVNCASPVGMGFLHYKADDYSDSKIKRYFNGTDIYIDYHDGRMTKFNGKKISDTEWAFPDSTNPEYQSWAMTHPTYQDLFDAINK